MEETALTRGITMLLVWEVRVRAGPEDVGRLLFLHYLSCIFDLAGNALSVAENGTVPRLEAGSC